MTEGEADKLLTEFYKIVRELDYAPRHSTRIALDKAVAEYYAINQKLLAALCGEQSSFEFYTDAEFTGEWRHFAASRTPYPGAMKFRAIEVKR